MAIALRTSGLGPGPLPLAGDLNCDGIPDTGDNDADGDVDWRDVDRNEDDAIDARDHEDGKPERCEGDVGPLEFPHTDHDRSDPLYHFQAVVPEGRPTAFTNPLVLDLDGNGFSGPEL